MQPHHKDSFASAVGSVLIWIGAVLWTLFVGFALLPFMILRLGGVVHWAGHYWGRVLLGLGRVTVHVENPERLYRSGPVIFLCNHQSLVDVLVFFDALRVDFAWMAKASLFKIPIFGWGMAAAGYIPVERGDRGKSLQSLYDAADKVKAGQSVIIFPEGTRGHPDGTMHAFKKGGFILAKRAGVVIQPLTISGANTVMPPKQRRGIQRVYPGHVHLVIHPPLMPEDYAELSVEELMAKTRTIIERPLDRLRALAEAGQ
jgi:1-acyl-sn-glycerol-3-phosphate acyltransferase